MENEEKAKSFSHRLAGRRLNLGLSQSQLADKAGVSVRSVQLWEGGADNSMPTGKSLHKLCKALEVGIEYFWPDAGEADEGLHDRIGVLTRAHVDWQTRALTAEAKLDSVKRDLHKLLGKIIDITSLDDNIDRK